MKENISAYRIANAVRMARGPSFPGAFFIVEGEASEYGRFIDRELCRIMPAHSKENAIHALNILENANFAGVLAVVDADFWRPEGKEPNSPNLFITDTHDLETMILKSPALEKLLTEFGSASKIEKLTQKSGKNIRDILLDGGVQIGYLRWVSHRDGLALKFEGIVFSNFIDREMLKLDHAKMIAAVKDRSMKHDLDERDLLKSLSELANPNHDPWNVCCGHDLVCILFIGFRRALGRQEAIGLQQVKPELLERFLRLAYETTYFFTTHLCKSLKAWERTNPSFRIFPAS